MLKNIIFLVVAFILSAQFVVAQTLTKEEIAVYTAVIDQTIKKNNSSKFVLIAELSFVEKKDVKETSSNERKINRNPYGDMIDDMQDDYVSKNLVKFNNDAFSDTSVIIAEEKIINKIFGIKNIPFSYTNRPKRNKWKRFYKKFPEASSVYKLSRIGFSKNGEFAIIVVNGYGSSHSFFTQYVLRKNESGWVLHDKLISITSTGHHVTN